ncbi:uncharacterized protein K489DRAFT_327313, partial [Dissoconium aciculare CBS 342.82]|uniref:C2H2-type domain-containing protein n=1 Tax=Dissoconium aciculare CBS 342.82 TaxID=1314786 RepID=A0A6J3LVG5_9PEZI
MVTLTCGTCGKSFSKKEHYVRHLRVHTHERPFACHACGQKFARRDTLKRHQISH